MRIKKMDLLEAMELINRNRIAGVDWVIDEYAIADTDEKKIKLGTKIEYETARNIKRMKEAEFKVNF